MGLTYVGAVEKDKKEIPAEFLPIRDQPANLACCRFNWVRTVQLSFVPKKNRSVIFISIMHYSTEIYEKNKQKQELVCFYNTTKYGIGLLGMKCAVYTSNKRTRMLAIVSLAHVTAYIFYVLLEHNAYVQILFHKTRHKIR